MLKKSKIVPIGIVLMVVLLITLPPLSACAVNIPAPDGVVNNTSMIQKWVTKNVKGFGDVTAPEEMFESTGNETKIILNKDYQI